jgi:predicted PurR-regulated permease PerM
MRDTQLMVIFLAVLTFLAVGFLLHQLASILLPLAVAFFLSMIFSPLVSALRRRRVPAAVSILVVLLLVSAVLFGFSSIVYSSAKSFKENMPRYKTRLVTVQSNVTHRVSASFPWLARQIQGVNWDQAVDVSSVSGYLASGLGSFLATVDELVLVILYLVFLLIGHESFPRKLNKAFAEEQAGRLNEVMHNIELGLLPRKDPRKGDPMKTILINRRARPAPRGPETVLSLRDLL